MKVIFGIEKIMEVHEKIIKME